MTRTLNLCASVSLISLTFLCLAWEFWLSPVRAGGSALALKALPLLIPLFGILHGRRYTHQWASFLALAYITEGIVRSVSDAGLSRWLAVAEPAEPTAKPEPKMICRSELVTGSRARRWRCISSISTASKK